jgi:predicted Fe-S protein YdhL (DUF1289 family)
MKKMETPCVKVCVIDEKTTHGAPLCIGCGRTRREIAEWTCLTKNERLSIMAECLVRIERMTKRGKTDSGKNRRDFRSGKDLCGNTDS